MHPHLLVATDFSPPSKKMLRRLDAFRDYGATKVTLLYVRRKKYPTEESSGHENYYQTLLDEQAAGLRDRGWQVDVRNDIGRAGSRIVEVAGEVGADMIVLANRGHSAVEDVLLGSVATDVLERSSHPVFLFCEGAESGEETTELWNRVIHPTDFSGAADDALEWIPGIVEHRPAAVMLFHVVDDRYHGPKTADDRKQKIDERREKLEAEGIAELDAEVVFGRPKKCLVELAEHYPQALFVMGAHGHGWFEDLVLGGIARSMARRGTNHLLFVPGSE